MTFTEDEINDILARHWSQDFEPQPIDPGLSVGDTGIATPTQETIQAIGAAITGRAKTASTARPAVGGLGVVAGERGVWGAKE